MVLQPWVFFMAEIKDHLIVGFCLIENYHVFHYFLARFTLVISIKDTTKGSTQAPLLYQRPSTFHRRKQSEQRSYL